MVRKKMAGEEKKNPWEKVKEKWPWKKRKIEVIDSMPVKEKEKEETSPGTEGTDKDLKVGLSDTSLNNVEDSANTAEAEVLKGKEEDKKDVVEKPDEGTPTGEREPGKVDESTPVGEEAEEYKPSSMETVEETTANGLAAEEDKVQMAETPPATGKESEDVESAAVPVEEIVEEKLDAKVRLPPEEKKEEEEVGEKPKGWSFIGRSVRGSLHLLRGIENQDAIEPEGDASGEDLVVCISDGHGGDRYFRSKKGAEFAVEASKEMLTGFFDIARENKVTASVIDNSRERIPKKIVEKWSKEDLTHEAENPFTEEEKEKLRQKEIEKLENGNKLEREAIIKTAYGATLLSVVVTKDYIIYVQLGDGDLLMVSKEGKVSRAFTRDSNLIANETTSLCSKDAWKHFDVKFQNISSNSPALIMLCTDGYANSFVDEESFLSVASDIWEFIVEDGAKEVSKSLGGWLEEASKEGSGDDITVGILYRNEAVKELSKTREEQ